MRLPCSNHKIRFAALTARGYSLPDEAVTSAGLPLAAGTGVSYKSSLRATNAVNVETRRLRNEAMDEAALRHQLAEHHLAGYGWALHCCARNPAQAEDVLQTVYLKILQGKARFDGRSSFKTWLFGVIRLTALQERRHDWLRRLRLLRYEPEQPTPPHDSENERLLQQALTALPTRQREVLHLVFYQDLTIEEAGTVMGVSLGSARTHYERGKQRLREILAPVAAPFTGAQDHAGVKPAATP